MKKQMILLGMLMAFCMAEAKVTLPALFTDNMVLQQKSNVIFHGHSSTKKELGLSSYFSFASLSRSNAINFAMISSQI